MRMEAWDHRRMNTCWQQMVGHLQSKTFTDRRGNWSLLHLQQKSQRKSSPRLPTLCLCVCHFSICLPCFGTKLMCLRIFFNTSTWWLPHDCRMVDTGAWLSSVYTQRDSRGNCSVLHLQLPSDSLSLSLSLFLSLSLSFLFGNALEHIFMFRKNILYKPSDSAT